MITLKKWSTLLPPATSMRCLLPHATLNTGQPVGTTYKHTIAPEFTRLNSKRGNSNLGVTNQVAGCTLSVMADPYGSQGEVHTVKAMLACSKLPLSVQTPIAPSMEPEKSNFTLDA